MAQHVKVYHPKGYPPKIEAVGMAPRPPALNGKTVYLVDCRFDDADLLMAQMRDWFAEHLPAVRTVLRSKAGVYSDRDPELYDEIRAQGDAAIVGVGH